MKKYVIIIASALLLLGCNDSKKVQREPRCLHDWSSRDEIQLLLILGAARTNILA